MRLPQIEAWTSQSKEEQIIGCLMMITGLLLIPYSNWGGWGLFWVGVSDHVLSIVYGVMECHEKKCRLKEIEQAKNEGVCDE